MVGIISQNSEWDQIVKNLNTNLSSLQFNLKKAKVDLCFWNRDSN